LIFSTEKQLEEFGEKLSEDNRAKIDGALAKLKEAHTAQDLEQIDVAMKEMETVWQAASQEMYAQAGAEGQAGPEAGAEGGEGAESSAEDVEYEEVK
jgi:molecular chaperone DnaK